jgi:hypothetical protein
MHKDLVNISEKKIIEQNFGQIFSKQNFWKIFA